LSTGGDRVVAVGAGCPQTWSVQGARGQPTGMLPTEDADEFDWLAFEQAGVLTSDQATRLLGRGTVRGLVRSGRWRSLCRGVLLTGNGRLSRDQQLWAAVLASGAGAVLAGATAAAEAGVRGLRQEPLHVLIPAARHASITLRHLPLDMPAVLVHRSAILPESHLQIGRPIRTTVARAVADAAGWARSADEARTVLAASCQQRRTTAGEIRAVVTALPKLRRRPLILRTLDDIEGGAQALSELDFVALCRRHRLPPPDLQQRRTDATGRVRYLDAYWRAWRLHVEIDGAHHMDVRHWAADLRRQNEIWIAGDRILRFPAWQVRSRPAEVAGQLRSALEVAGWRTTR
jgi:very-short-patch-repair endonuclease